MSQEFTIICPGCSSNIELEGNQQEWAGQTIECPECNAPIQLEAEEETAPEPEPKKVYLQNSSPVSSPVNASPNSCPSCSSNNIARCEMVHSQGTSTGMAAGQMNGINVGTYGVGVNSANIQMTTVSQTLLATKVAPPTNSAVLIDFVIAGILALIPASIWFKTYFMPAFRNSQTGKESSLGTHLLISFLLLIGGTDVFRLLLQRIDPFGWNKRYCIAIESWLKSWICLACGHIWQRH